MYTVDNFAFTTVPSNSPLALPQVISNLLFKYPYRFLFVKIIANMNICYFPSHSSYKVACYVHGLAPLVFY